MGDEQPESQLIGLDGKPLKVKELREIRALGSIDEEIEIMKKHEEEKKPFPEGELTICAMGATRNMCPFNTETWSCNMGYWQIFEMDGHFQRTFLTHTQVRDLRGKGAFNWDDFNKLVEAGVVVYNTHRVKGLNSKFYPFKRLAQKFDTEYFSNTIAYQIAFAIDMGCYHTIHIYGCDMMTQEEYAWEKGGIEYWLGQAHGRGIKTTIAEGSSLMKTITGKPYGVKYFRMKDIDPDGSLRKSIRKYAPLDKSTSVMYENPLHPPLPEPTKWVSEGAL